jgi:hypothetical protein
MTVDARVPFVEYIGNGIITTYAWDWGMHVDSYIQVRVDNENVTNWHLEGMTVVFDTAPADGSDVLIFRRTPVWHLENYRPFGRFEADKTESSVDRATYIAQEISGLGGNGYIFDGKVGGADLSLTRNRYDLTVVSERGTDAVLQNWDWSPQPDSTIIWAGDDIIVTRRGNTANTISRIFFYNFAVSGPAGQSNAHHTDQDGAEYNVYTGWLNFEYPADGAYWMRVTQNGTEEFVDYFIAEGQRLVIADQYGTSYALSDEPSFDAKNATITLETTTATPPATSFINLTVEICKDDGTGQPDGLWASRNVFVALEYII